MKFETVRNHLDGIPYLAPSQARILYDFVVAKRPERCLELGFAHGVSSCYIAAALDEAGQGQLTSVDLLDAAQWQKPSIEELLEKTGLASRVTVVRERTSYTWFLKKEIESNTVSNACSPVYDFCFVDGAKNWTIDGLAFFLVDKLLRADGWILFDDLKWTYASSLAPGEGTSDGVTVRRMGEDELQIPHIETVFRLLVMQHPSYGDLRIQDGWWGWARKSRSDRRVLRIEETTSLKTLVLRELRRIVGRRGLSG